MRAGRAGSGESLTGNALGLVCAQEMEASGAASEGTAATASTMNPKVIKVYRTVGRLLSKYRSGRLPKAFKIVPSLGNWESVLVLTNPEGWTAAAMYQATRIFASNLNARMAQRCVRGGVGAPRATLTPHPATTPNPARRRIPAFSISCSCRACAKRSQSARS